MTRLEQQMKFIEELDKNKGIERQTYILEGKRKENDAEHMFHLAIMAAVLSEHANEPVDVLKVMTMVLIHDAVEIDAGDTYAYDEAGNATKREREWKAADRIFHILPPDQEEYFRGLWEEFEANETPEARFANSLDKMQPTMLNHTSGGRTWKEHDVAVSQIYKRNENTANGSQALWDYAVSNFIEPHVEKPGKPGEIKEDRK
ncbi:MAG: HD domain-containing protein [Lachnospiraceae bacterium]|nr:HD domain-containing protein [Lachnospiraceae bacterium]